jgi:hypothetical protein
VKKIYIIWLIALLLATLLISAIPAIAENPSSDNKESKDIIVPPLSDPSKANYDSPTINNLLDPRNPNYDPSGIYGPEGTRFGPPGKRSPDISELSKGIISPLAEDHQNWGTNVYYNSSIYGIYGYQAVFTTINLNESSDTLYAPTMLCPNQCPYEMTTYYVRSWITTNRYVKLYNFNTGGFGAYIPIDATFVSNYVRNGNYIGELLYDSSKQQWHAYLYKWSTSTWDGLGDWASPRSGQTAGWDIWEEYNLSNNWPTLPQIWSNYLSVRIGSTGNDWRRVTSTYGNSGWTMTAPYPHNFVNNYYYWKVGPGPQ